MRDQRNIFVRLTILIVLLSESGTALFFALVPLMVPLSEAAGISAIYLSVPLGLAGNLMRAVSPVSAVVVIVSAAVKETPLDIVKRTSIPMIAGIVFMFVLSMIFFVKNFWLVSFKNLWAFYLHVFLENLKVMFYNVCMTRF